jgi:hypothetical protein
MMRQNLLKSGNCYACHGENLILGWLKEKPWPKQVKWRDGGWRSAGVIQAGSDGAMQAATTSRQVVTTVQSVQTSERLRECYAVVFAFASELPWIIARKTT